MNYNVSNQLHMQSIRIARRSSIVVALIELLFVFVDAVFVAPRSEELGIGTY